MIGSCRGRSTDLHWQNHHTGVAAAAGSMRHQQVGFREQMHGSRAAEPGGRRVGRSHPSSPAPCTWGHRGETPRGHTDMFCPRRWDP